MSDDLRIDLFGVECNTDVPDGNGVVWDIEPVNGWLSPSMRSERSMATGRVGTVLLDERHGERLIEVKGLATAPDHATAWAAYNQLNVMPGSGASGEIILYEPGVPKALTVRQGEDPRGPDPVGRQVEFLLTLVALYPYKRSVSAVVTTIAPGATVNLTNNGTAPAYLTIQATGSGTVRVQQMDSGQVLRSKTTVASGTTFDAARKRVTTSGGTVLFGVVDNPSEWLSIPQLDSAPVKNEGTAPIDVTFYHSYA